jgi:1,4-dihydroxy-2-naphthoate polyprenyltransferase
MQIWIKAARLSTLPLAISGILLGSAFSLLNHCFNWQVLLFGILTAAFLQILSNYSNDYGDFSRGTDQLANRKDRVLAAGEITPSTMFKGIVVVGSLALLFGIALLFVALQHLNLRFLLFFALGLSAIAAAIKYTVGKGAYAYYGLGDLFVLLFFGLVAVIGILYLHCGAISTPAWLGATGMGLLSAAVLNVNNMRDIHTDKASGKITLVVKMGSGFAKVYHRFLIVIGAGLLVGSFYLHRYESFGRISLGEGMMIAVIFSPGILLLSSHVSRTLSLEAGDREPWNKELKSLSMAILAIVCIYLVVSFFFAA